MSLSTIRCLWCRNMAPKSPGLKTNERTNEDSCREQAIALADLIPLKPVQSEQGRGLLFILHHFFEKALKLFPFALTLNRLIWLELSPSLILSCHFGSNSASNIQQFYHRSQKSHAHPLTWDWQLIDPKMCRNSPQGVPTTEQRSDRLMWYCNVWYCRYCQNLSNPPPKFEGRETLYLPRIIDHRKLVLGSLHRVCRCSLFLLAVMLWLQIAWILSPWTSLWTTRTYISYGT